MPGALKIALINGKFPNYYLILGVSRTAAKCDIIKAYKKTALAQHPDKVGGGKDNNEAFAHVNNARDVICDPEKRREYDAQLSKVEAKTTNQVQPAPRQTAVSPRKPDQYRPNHQEQQHHPKQSRKDSLRFPQSNARQKYSGEYRSRYFTQPPLTEPIYSTDRSYVPFAFPVSFRGFKPPASAYPHDPTHFHFGTKPDPRGFWSQVRWGGASIGVLHETVCANAIRICYLANSIDRTLSNIRGVAPWNLNQPPVLSDPANLHKRLECCIEVLREVMHFAANSYYYHRGQIDLSIHMSSMHVGPVLDKQYEALSRLVMVMTNFKHHLEYALPILRDPMKSVLSAMHHLGEALNDWQGFCELPLSLIEAGVDAYTSAADVWRNDWQRRRDGPNWYPFEAFEMKHGDSIVPPSAASSAHSYTQPSGSGTNSRSEPQQPRTPPQNYERPKTPGAPGRSWDPDINTPHHGRPATTQSKYRTGNQPSQQPQQQPQSQSEPRAPFQPPSNTFGQAQPSRHFQSPKATFFTRPEPPKKFIWAEQLNKENWDSHQSSHPRKWQAEASSRTSGSNGTTQAQSKQNRRAYVEDESDFIM